ncbi:MULTISPECIES: ABC transporter substrate-binding protein [Clostridium]|uniref:ABC transporter substrate-binding protein n=1 Tax=Clostridium TaxID=1485 RepID=UPI000825CB4C|nr:MULTISPECIES: ABC transporter substrate-binding protein [Clostridium]PJI09112.1 carbohydrate ABC transporter substrate-binding protein [Clostridium sp. CT7]
MKKFFIRMLALIMCVGVVFYASACGTIKNKTSEQKVKKVNNKPGNITIWINSKNENIIKDQINMFNKKYNYIAVNAVFMSEEDIIKNYENNYKNNGKLPDVVEISDLNAAEFVNKYKQKLVNVSSDSDIKNDMFLSNKIHNLTQNSKVYGYPWYTEPEFMIYRSDILKQLKIDPDDIKTWKDYNEVGNTVKQNGKNLMYSSDLGNIYDVCNSELGVNFLDDNDKVDVKDEKFKESANFIFDIIKNNTNISITPGKDIPKAFSTGEVVSMIVSPEEMLYLQNDYPGLKGKICVENLPAFEEGGNNTAYKDGANLILSSNEKTKSYAEQFAKFVTGNEEAVYNQFSIYALCSSNSSVYNYDKIHKKNDYVGGKDIYKMYMNSAKLFSDIKYYKDYSDIRNYVIKEIGDEAAQNKGIDEIISNMQKVLSDKYK